MANQKGKKRIPVKGYVEIPEDDRADLHVGTGGLRDDKGIAALAHLEEDTGIEQEEAEKLRLQTEFEISKNSREEAKDQKKAEQIRLCIAVYEFFRDNPEVASWIANRVMDAGHGLIKGFKCIRSKFKKKTKKSVSPVKKTQNAPTSAPTASSKNTSVIFATIHQYRQIPEIDPATTLPFIEELLRRYPESAKDPKIQKELLTYKNREFIEKQPLAEYNDTLSDTEESISYDEELMNILGL